MIPVIEAAIGLVNGSNRLFLTQSPYIPRSLRVFLNGILGCRQLEEGWEELGGQRFVLYHPPKPPDVVQVYYCRL